MASSMGMWATPGLPVHPAVGAEALALPRAGPLAADRQVEELLLDQANLVLADLGRRWPCGPYALLPRHRR